LSSKRPEFRRVFRDFSLIKVQEGPASGNAVEKIRLRGRKNTVKTGGLSGRGIAEEPPAFYGPSINRYVSGTDVPPYETIFGYAGYQLERVTRKLPYLGVSLDERGRVTSARTC
jgi:hypothetical protein